MRLDQLPREEQKIDSFLRTLLDAADKRSSRAWMG